MVLRIWLLIFISLVFFITYAKNVTSKQSTTNTTSRFTSSTTKTTSKATKSLKTTSKPTRKVKDTRENEFKLWAVSTKSFIRVFKKVYFKDYKFLKLYRNNITNHTKTILNQKMKQLKIFGIIIMKLRSII